jgi:hypothetical protein
MPYKIRKIRNKPLYSVKNLDNGVFHSYATTLANAKKQVALLQAIDNN